MGAAWQKANPEKVKAVKAVYYAAHREQFKARSRAYYAANREKVKAYNAAYYAATRESRSALDRLGKYGLTEDQYQTQLLLQNGCCAICYFQMSKPEVDHDHATGEVRGLLCHPCNVKLDHPRRTSPFSAAEAFYLQAEARP